MNKENLGCAETMFAKRNDIYLDLLIAILFDCIW